MIETLPFIDPHVHAESRSTDDFARLKTAGCRGIMAVAGPSAGYRSSDSLFDHFRRLDKLDRLRIENHGLQAWLALGVHPAGIPEKSSDTFFDQLQQALSDYQASAIGEIGLEDMSRLEELYLEKQLQLAAKLNYPALVHTPRHKKAQAIEKTLEILSRSSLPREKVLLDHLDEHTVEIAKDSGCWLGLSVHPNKLSPRQTAELIATHGPDRFVISSDLGAMPGHLFAIPAAISAMRDLDIDDQNIKAVVHDHMAEILGLDY